MLVAFWGVKGGSGTTVSAAICALAWARPNRQVLLVDLGGDLPAALGCAPLAGPGCAEWLRAGVDAEPEALTRIESEVGDGVRLLQRGSGQLEPGPALGEFIESLVADSRLVLADCGEPLSGDRITQVYRDIQRRYHGADEGVMRIDDLHNNEWLFVPHFYFNFYVFQYSTSIAGAAYFVEQILTGGPENREIYLDFLKAGGSKHHKALLAPFGLDASDPAFWDKGLSLIESFIDELETMG